MRRALLSLGSLLVALTLGCAGPGELPPDDDAALPQDSPPDADTPTPDITIFEDSRPMSDTPSPDITVFEDTPPPRDTAPTPDTALPPPDTRPPPDTAPPPDTTPPPDMAPPPDGPPSGPGEPPFGASSMGSGGAAPVAGELRSTSAGVMYRLIVPVSRGRPYPMLVIYSGTEGGATMTRNLQSLGGMVGLGDAVVVVLDGVQYRGNATAGAGAMDDVRARYNIDNDRTWLLGESAGTTAALALGFTLRQSYFAAYWANDVNATGRPARSAAELGFAPWGNAGPGGQFASATAIVSAMRAAGYRLQPPAPYDGPGAGTHGDPNQFIAALRFFPGRTRRP